MSKIVNLFPDKEEKVNKSPEEIVENFHAKLDEVLDEFHLLNAAEKFKVFEDVVLMNKTIFGLYMDLKKRHEYCMIN